MPTPGALRDRLDRMRIQVLLPITGSAASTADLARAVIRGGADAIQLREKSADDAAFLEAAGDLRKACDEGGAILIVNDRVGAVLPSRADGVHLGQGDTDLREARRLLGEGSIIGSSCHSLEEALRARDGGADYIAIGCIFRSPTKPHLRPAGVDRIARIAAEVGLPLVAIGGIRPENAASVFEAGAHAVAVSSAILEASDPEAAVRRLRAAIPVH